MHYKKNKCLFFSYQLESEDGITIVKDGAHHKLIIHDCQERDAGKYKFEAEGRKSEAALNVKGRHVFCFSLCISIYNWQ